MLKEKVMLIQAKNLKISGCINGRFSYRITCKQPSQFRIIYVSVQLKEANVFYTKNYRLGTFKKKLNNV